MFRTGELAKKTNISRRTLHYYDEIDLLKPTKVDDNNYRYYNQHALLRLQEIRLLKSIGFTLQQIKQMISRSMDETDKEMWTKSLRNQIRFVQKEKEKLERKQYYLQTTLQAIQVTGQINAVEIFKLIQSLEDRQIENGVVPATFPDQLFTDEEQEILKQLPVLGSDNPQLDNIIQLVQQIRLNMSKPPSNAMIQELAESLHLQIAQLFQGNMELLEKYWKLITPEDNQSPVIYGLDQELVNYVNRMFDYYHTQQQE